MDTFKLLLTAAQPKTFPVRYGVYSALALITLSLLSYPHQFFFWHYEEKYRLTVCWDEYTQMMKSINLLDIYPDDGVERKVVRYQKCLSKARSWKRQ